MRKYTTEEYVNNAKNIKNNKDIFDYSKTIYTGSQNKIEILCLIHGSFWQLAGLHLSKKQGCPKCAIENRVKLLKSNTQDFVKKSIEIHGIEFNYSETDYINNHLKVKIICSIHGAFWQTPSAHLSGCGCKKCYIMSLTGSTEKFINKANIFHKFEFDYSKTIYKNNHTKVIIICLIHGEFTQTPAKHLSGTRCPKCKESSGEKLIRAILKENNIKFSDQYKINECKNINPLPFDFAIFKNEKLFGLIEYNGLQHYAPYSFGSKSKTAEEMFNKIQVTDKIKSDFCQRNKIPLLIIPYWEKKNIVKILESTFKI